MRPVGGARPVRVAAAMVALAAMAVAHPAGAYVRSESNWDPSTMPIQYRINTASAPSSIGAAVAMSALQGGETSWAGPGCTTWRTTLAGTSSVAQANAMDGENTMLWRSDAWPAELGDVHVTIGVTTPIWTVGGYYLDADIQFNNVGFTWNTSGTGGTVDTQSIATHEQGHFLGLGHPPVPEAVMYASYSGGLKRTLTADDIGGVCAIYPSGGAVPDAGTMPPPPGDPCGMYSSCDGCTPVNGCGWCGTTGQCLTGGQTGPSTGSCGSWAWVPRDCSSTSMSPTDAGVPTMGGAAFGEPCTNPADCASGGVCLQVTDRSTGMIRTFCSRSCSMGNDCTCPRDYRCLSGMDSSGSTVTFCVPGTSTCTTPPPVRDAGTPPNDGGTGARDAGTTHRDAGRTDAVATDGGAALDGGGVPLGGSTGSTAGCGCTVPGTPSGRTGLAGLVGLALSVGAFRRRRVA